MHALRRLLQGCAGCAQGGFVDGAEGREGERGVEGGADDGGVGGGGLPVGGASAEEGGFVGAEACVCCSCRLVY